MGIPPVARGAIAAFFKERVITFAPPTKRSNPPSLLSFGLDVREFFDQNKKLSTGFGFGVLSEPDTRLSHNMDKTSLNLHLRPYLANCL